MDNKALLELTHDMLEQKRKEKKYLFIALIISLVINVVIVGAFLWYESTWDYATTTTTTQTVDGKGNDIVNGNQYNDKSQDNSKGADK